MKKSELNRILVIDDEPIVRENISVYLEDSNFCVAQADDGLKGLDQFYTFQPDVILLDLRMPKMDGISLMAEISKESPDTPVIVITGAGVINDAISALKLGAFDYITKPIKDMAVLEHIVKKALTQKQLVLDNLEYKQHLEEKIEARTATLKRKTRELEHTNMKLTQSIRVQKKIFNALSHSEKRLKEMISFFEGFIYTCSEDYTIEFMNKKLIDYIGMDAIGHKCFDSIFGEKKICPWCLQKKALDGKSVKAEIQNPKDGRWFYSIYTPRYNSSGEISKGQVMIIDITERKQQEELLKISEAKLRKKNQRLTKTIKRADRFGRIIGKSKAMMKVYDAIMKAADSSAHVIIYGESGTGKELVAKTIHDLSDRSKNQFVTVHCGAIPDHLIESEFFGYRKGAFTGAHKDKIGYLVAADKGSLFMDEIGELNQIMQVKLLRAIEGGGFTPIGDHKLRNTNVRIIAATNRNLKERVDTGDFREDFFYRIHIIPIYLPPLRERKEDIIPLAHHFLSKYSKNGSLHSIDRSVTQAMNSYHWPGNVRELENSIHRYITFNQLDFLTYHLKGDLGKTAQSNQEKRDQIKRSQRLSDLLEETEKRYIQKILAENQWHRGKTAEILGIDRRTLFRKMKYFGL